MTPRKVLNLTQEEQAIAFAHAKEAARAELRRRGVGGKMLSEGLVVRTVCEAYIGYEVGGADMDAQTIECFDCGGEYVWDEESAEDHEPDCPVRQAYINLGRWDDPEGQ